MRLTLSNWTARRARPRREIPSGLAENCESRCVLNAVWPAVAEPLPNDTLDIAEDLGDLIRDLRSSTNARIGDSPAFGADVDWYRFRLDEPRLVSLNASPSSDQPANGLVLSLFNDSPFTFEDLQNPLGHRLISQGESTSSGSAAEFLQVLAPGQYFVAVSGAGNRNFHPFLENSGTLGTAGEYELAIDNAALDGIRSGAPAVISSEPAAGEQLNQSPFVIRVQFSSELDPGTLSADDSVQLVFSPNDDFTDGDESLVPTAVLSFSGPACELQLTPALPLPPGFYQVVLAGDSSNHFTVLTDLNGVPLGATDESPVGQDVVFTFQITGAEGVVSDGFASNDTPDTAQDLGELAAGELRQARGAIGDDPSYDPNIDWLLNPANDVDLFHFRVVGDELFSLVAEVFASRIGSPLDSGVSLFRFNADTNSLDFVAGNNNTFNAVEAANGTLPLFTDSVLFAGVTAGDYFVAVSSGLSAPSPDEGQFADLEGIYNPMISHSGRNGGSTGRYVLNLQIIADAAAPQVLATTPADAESLLAPPTRLTVQFDEAVNLNQLAFAAFQQTFTADLPFVFVQSAGGTQFFPRIENYDSATNTATFLMLDGLSNGAYELHLSGPLGIADLASRTLVGNDASGDFVVRFEVLANPRGSDRDPTLWLAVEPTDGGSASQDLGVLFGHELEAGVTISRDPAAAGSNELFDSEDVFRIEVLAAQPYHFSVSGDDLPDAIAIAISDEWGNAVPSSSSDNGRAIVAALNPGVYFVSVSGWSADEAANVAYQLQMSLIGVPDNPPPLTSGPAPALHLRLAGTSSIVAAPPQVVLGNVPSVASASAPLPLDSRSLSFMAPTASLASFGSNLMGGVGGTSTAFAATDNPRVVLRLPEWFEWAALGTRDLVLRGDNLESLGESLRDETDDSTNDPAAETSPENSAEAPADSDAADPMKTSAHDAPVEPNEAAPPAAVNAGEQPAAVEATSSSPAPAAAATTSVFRDERRWLAAIAVVFTNSVSGREQARLDIRHSSRRETSNSRRTSSL